MQPAASPEYTSTVTASATLCAFATTASGTTEPARLGTHAPSLREDWRHNPSKLHNRPGPPRVLGVRNVEKPGIFWAMVRPLSDLAAWKADFAV